MGRPLTARARPAAAQSEIKRRTDADQLMQSSIQTEMKAVQDKVMLQVREHNLALKASIDALSRSFAELHGALREEKESRLKDMEQLAITVASKVEEVQGSVDDERVNRLEREAQTLKRIGDDVFKCQEKIDVQRRDMDAHVQSLQAEVQSVTGAKNSAEDRFQAVVQNELNALKAAVAAEREERQSEDEQIVHAINDYTRALQDGLRIVNNT